MNAQVIYRTFQFTIVACRVIIFKWNIELRKKQREHFGLEPASQVRLNYKVSWVTLQQQNLASFLCNLPFPIDLVST